jgi:carbamoylphosphate synthase small subunit
MTKDFRYKAVEVMIRSKGINTFREIFDQIPRTVVAVDMGFNNNRMRDLVKYPLQLKLVEIDKMAALFGCTPDQLIRLIRAQ